MSTPFAQQVRRTLLDDLTTFFAEAEGDQGLRSSWGPLADIALGGFGGTPDPERRVDHLLLGPVAENKVTAARRVRSALLGLAPSAVGVLYAAHGPTPWGRVIDSAFGRGMGEKVAKRLGPLVGVALLTEAVRVGYAGAPDLPDRKPSRFPWEERADAWATPGGWLVTVAKSKEEGDKRRIERVRAEAAALLGAAEAAYLAGRGLVQQPADELAPRRSRLRLAPIEPTAGVGLQ